MVSVESGDCDKGQQAKDFVQVPIHPQVATIMYNKSVG